MQAGKDGGASLGTVALDQGRVLQLDPPGLLQDAVQQERLRRDAPEILPHAERNGLALLRRLLRHHLLKVLERAPVTAGLGRDEAPYARGYRRGHVERHCPHEEGDGQQEAIFKPLADIEEHGSGFEPLGER